MATLDATMVYGTHGTSAAACIDISSGDTSLTSAWGVRGAVKMTHTATSLTSGTEAPCSVDYPCCAHTSSRYICALQLILQPVSIRWCRKKHLTWHSSVLPAHRAVAIV